MNQTLIDKIQSNQQRWKVLDSDDEENDDDLGNFKVVDEEWLWEISTKNGKFLSIYDSFIYVYVSNRNFAEFLTNKSLLIN